MNKSKKAKMGMILLIGLLILTGCTEAAGEIDSIKLSADDNKVLFPYGFMSFSNNGVCSNIDCIAHFWDKKSGRDTVLCTKPNCTHIKSTGSGMITKSCDAYLGSRADLFFMAGNSIYYLSSPENSTDGLSWFFDRELVRADLDGHNKKKICEFKNVGEVGGIGNACYSDDWFAFGYYTTISTEKKDGISLDSRDKWIAGVYLVNLKKEEVYLIKQIEEYNAMTYYIYIDSEKVYYILAYHTENIEFTDYDAQDYYEKMSKIRRFELYSYDIITGENTLVWKDVPEYINAPSSGYYVFDYKKESVLYKDGKEKARYQKEDLTDHDGLYINKYVYNDILYMADCQKVWCLDIESGELRSVGNGKLDGKNIGNIVAMFKDVVYYNVVEPYTGATTLYAMSFCDFSEGNIENAVKINIQ